MSGPFGSSQWIYSSGAGGFYPTEIEQSLRFNDNDSAYLSRTPASAGNRKTWTWSGWVKRGNLGINGNLFSSDTNNISSQHRLRFTSGNKLDFFSYDGSNDYKIETSALFRDVSAWYHVVAVYDTSNATSTDRMRLYVNGDRITSFSTTRYPALNYDGILNNSVSHNIGRWVTSGYTSEYFDGYLAEVNFIDGQALDPTDFGEFKSGVWVAKSYAGSYGTNGFYLDFSNSGSLGADSSGNGNNWTANNLAATDQVLDSPTNNFATVNRLEIRTASQEGNLEVVGQADACPTFHIPSTGKWYAEFVPTAIGNNTHFGFTRSDKDALNHSEVDSFRMVVPQGGSLYLDGTGLSSPQSASGYSQGNVLSLAIDMDNGNAYWRANNSIIASLTGQSVIQNNTWKFLTYMNGTNDAFVHNYGQDSSFAGNKTAQGNTDDNGQGDFYYTPPSGYLALCSANLSVAEAVDPAEDNSPQDYFNTVLYSGTGSSQTITGVGFQPDWVWLKPRNVNDNHHIYDVVRGVQKGLFPNSSGGELTSSTTLTAFNSDGFTVNTDSGVNGSGRTFASWNWKAGGSPVTNTSGTITSSVSTNTDAGFSVLTYTGNGVTGATVGHGLGKAPDFYWVRWRNNTSNFHVYHSSLGATKGLILNETNSVATNAGFWNNTEPTSSVFSLGSYGGSNAGGGLFSAVCFTEIEGFSSFGQYSGNGSTDGPFVYTGHRPAFVLVKRIDSGENWLIFDDERLGYNVLNNFLYPNQSQKEDVASDFPRLDLLSNGFKWRTNTTDVNTSGGTYIYMSFAHNPFKYALAR